MRPRARSQHEPLRVDLVIANSQRFGRHEPRLAEEHVDAALAAVGHCLLMQGVDAAEHPLPDGQPVRSGPFGTDPELARVPDGLGNVGGVHQHLRRDASPVQASAAKPAAFHQRDPPASELLHRQHVPAARPDNYKIITVDRHLTLPSWPSASGTPVALTLSLG